MTYLLTFLGLLLGITGLILFNKKQSETKIIKANTNNFNNKNNAFESFVIRQFDKKYFTLQKWDGHKHMDDNYSISNHFPDLEVAYKWEETDAHFAIECKWYKNYYKGAIEWAKGYQLKNYQEYAQRIKLPVYIIIGVGGKPEMPKELFVIPLKDILVENIEKVSLLAYRKKVGSSFFWDNKKELLK